jgi:hypothetical protein
MHPILITVLTLAILSSFGIGYGLRAFTTRTRRRYSFW